MTTGAMHRAAAGTVRGGGPTTATTGGARPRHRTAAVRAVAGLTVRLVGRGTAVLAALLGTYCVLEVLTFHATYPDGIGASTLQMFDTPAVRMLQGPPTAIRTAGGFTAWDDGWVMAAAVGIWALLVSTRLLRAEEDDERAAALLAAPMTARTLVAVRLAVLSGGCALVAAAVGGTLAASGEAARGSVLFGLTIGGFAAVWVAVGAVCAQVVEPRRRAVVAGSAAFGVAYAVRLFANSTPDRAPLRRVTPWGWLDEVVPFGDGRVWPVVAMWTSALALGGLAVAARGLRDTGGAFWARPDRRRARLRGLGGPLAFGWRQGRGVVVAWAVGLVAYSAMLGGLLRTMLDFLSADAAYRAALEALGLSSMLTPDGYVSVLAVLFGVVLALYACWRVGAARTEEAEGRLESVLVRPVGRRQWLWSQIGLVIVTTAALAVLSGSATWAAARITGADLAATSAIGAMLNQLPVALLFTGLSTLVLGLAPRLTLVLPASLAGIGYVVELVGPPLDWPRLVLDLSPFHHLAYVPAVPFAVLPALVLTGLGVAATVTGVELFRRRDLAGG